MGLDKPATPAEQEEGKQRKKRFRTRLCIMLAVVSLLIPTIVVAAVETQVPLHRAHHSAHPSKPVTTVAPTSPEGEDFYDCVALGHNGCWAPSLPGTGSPYMHDGEWPKRSKKCVVKAGGDPRGDDTPAILDAFSECKTDGHIVFENTTYYVGTVMNTTGLQGVDVEVNGTLLWSDNVQYWLKNSLPVGFQNQSSAWLFGGDDVHFYGHGFGTLDGNGQVWYDYNQGQSNLHGRPHAITISQSTNSVVEGLRFVQSQMWTMTVARSERVLLQDIYVNSSAAPGRDFRSIVNTDGVDTVYADNITFLRWIVDNGDDSISMKQNSTNIYIANCTFYNGLSFAMGSIGQYPGQIEVIANVTAENITLHNTIWGARIKSWTGINTGFPPNGGGGGFGYAKNITFRAFEMHNVQRAWGITQCTSYNGVKGGCDTSPFEISDLNWGESNGTVRGDTVATLDCSAKAPCDGINIYDNDLTNAANGQPASVYLCDNVAAKEGFDCTDACKDRCPH